MTETSNMPWNIIIGTLATITGGLVLFYLRDIKQSLYAMSGRIDRQDKEIRESKDDVALLAQRMAECKVDCERQFVSSESFIKSEAYTRKKLDGIAESFSALQGEIKIAARLPEIVGNITREVVKNINQDNKGDPT